MASVSTHLLGILWLAVSKLGGYEPDDQGLILNSRETATKFHSTSSSVDYWELFLYGYGNRNVKLTNLPSSLPRSRVRAYPKED
jgi:hypothetical protein